MRGFVVLAALFSAATPSHTSAREPGPGDNPWLPYLSTAAIGADQFIREHPTWDGRGVVIAVLDTGVDTGVAGLRTTSTGEPKVIAVRDFSRQGRLTLEDAVRETEAGVATLRHEDVYVRGFEALTPQPEAGSFRIAALEESAFVNSSVEDLNANGSTGDVFAVLAWDAKRPDGTVEHLAVVDRDGDRDVSDEAPIRSYEQAQEFFVLEGFDPTKRTAPLTFALYLDPALATVEVHFDDGGHGTHVAGIAAGHAIDAQQGYDGVAPGAQVLSLKIGNNSLAGGSTTSGAKKDALAWAAKWAEDHDTHVVVNLSYGIGSEVEGDSDIDREVDRVLQHHPRLHLSTSAGNAGPGISTVGQPAAAALAFTAGAALTPENARGIYGRALDGPRVFWFSSRGGELSKPDALLPGIAASTVPRWFGDAGVMRGTSMASPQAAGAMALLLSGARERGLEVNSGMVRRALRASGRPLSGYTPIDQGTGLVHVPEAFEILEDLAKSPEARAALGYRVSAPCPTCTDGDGPASYWRTGGYVPPHDRVQRFTVTPLLATPAGSTREQRDAFSAIFDLDSDVPWLDARTSTLQLRGEGAAIAEVSIRADRIEEPGLYVGRVRGVAEGGPSGARGAAFELLTTVVKPWEFDRAHGWRREWKRRSIERSGVDRYFILAPPAASTLFVDLQVAGRGTGELRVVLYSPEGRQHWLPGSTADAARKGKVALRLDRDVLGHGIWEVDIIAPERNTETLRYDLEARFTGFEAPTVSLFTIPQGGEPEATAEVTNVFDVPFRGKARGRLTGYSRKDLHDVDGDTYEMPFKVDSEMRRVVFDLSVDPMDYALFTDLAVNVLDSNGKAVVKGGFSQAHERITMDSPPPGSYTLQAVGALATGESATWSIEIDERYEAKEPLPVRTEVMGETHFTLYPGVTRTLDLTMDKRPQQPPDGYVHHGEVELVSDEDEKVWVVIPLRLDP